MEIESAIKIFPMQKKNQYQIASLICYYQKFKGKITNNPYQTFPKL